jgi:hypothetical protein
MLHVHTMLTICKYLDKVDDEYYYVQSQPNGSVFTSALNGAFCQIETGMLSPYLFSGKISAAKLRLFLSLATVDDRAEEEDGKSSLVSVKFDKDEWSLDFSHYHYQGFKIALTPVHVAPIVKNDGGLSDKGAGKIARNWIPAGTPGLLWSEKEDGRIYLQAHPDFGTIKFIKPYSKKTDKSKKTECKDGSCALTLEQLQAL